MRGRKLFDGKSAEVVVPKLEQAFALGCTDEEACCYAGISKSSLYRYQNDNIEFRERKHLLLSSLVLKARLTVMRALESDPKMAWDFLQKKRAEEFNK